MDVSLYYNPQKMLSHNRILNFVTGARGIGKTFGLKAHAVNRFLKYGEQFIYVKRHKTDLKKVNNFFADLETSGKFDHVDMQSEGKTFYINGLVAGWAIPLSMWQKEKSNAYPNVTLIVFDEFIREKDTSNYLPNEVDALLNLMDTVFRSRDNVRCVCLSNAVTLTNPYFVYFNIVPDTGKRFNKYQDILVEIPESSEFADYKRKTKFGSLINGTEYGQMAMDNEFQNSSVFLRKRTKHSRFQFTVIYNDMKMGVWVDVDEGLMFLSQDHDPSTRYVYALTKNDMNENTLLMSNWRQNYHLIKMVKAFKQGVLRFDNQWLRDNAYEMFNKMNIH